MSDWSRRMTFYTSGPAFDYKMLPPGANCLNCGAPGEGGSSCGYCGRFRSAKPDAASTLPTEPPYVNEEWCEVTTMGDPHRRYIRTF